MNNETNASDYYFKWTQQISCSRVVLDMMRNIVLSTNQSSKICFSNLNSQYQLKSWEIQAIWKVLIHCNPDI